MTDPFEDHCWRDVVPDKVLQQYRRFRRDVHVGAAPALIAIDLYELVYQGGPLPIDEVVLQYPSSCGEFAWAAIPPTKRLFEAARGAGIPIFYSTAESRPDAHPDDVIATKLPKFPDEPGVFDIRVDFAPQKTDTIIRKARASAFYGTPLTAHLVERGIQSVIMIGESTSGCLRASAVDAYSNGFHVTIVEECCYDRFLLSHQINLFDLHHKYADVMHVDEVIAHLESAASARV
jgi:nicotinamidase-related amidase